MSVSGRKIADDALIASLTLGSTIKDAAAKAGVHERTVRRRLAEPAFARRLAEAKAEALTRAITALHTAAVGAVGTLVRLLNAESEQVQLGSARAILDSLPRLREHAELIAEVAELKAGLADLKAARDGGQLRAVK